MKFLDLKDLFRSRIFKREVSERDIERRRQFYELVYNVQIAFCVVAEVAIIQQ